LLIENATAELHAARRRNLRDRAERQRLRHLVEEIDRVIQLCEETHLQRVKQITPAIAEAHARAMARARADVAGMGELDALRSLEGIARMQPRRIVHIMDALWAVQEVLFDLMQPHRTRLPEDADEAAALHRPLVHAAAAGSWRPAA
jgi:hypothetical protein